MPVGIYNVNTSAQAAGGESQGEGLRAGTVASNILTICIAPQPGCPILGDMRVPLISAVGINAHNLPEGKSRNPLEKFRSCAKFFPEDRAVIARITLTHNQESHVLS
jgi:hypothetical protein